MLSLRIKGQILQFFSLCIQLFTILDEDDVLDEDDPGSLSRELLRLVIQFFLMIVLLLDNIDDEDDDDDDYLRHLKPHQLLRYLAPLEKFRHIRRDVYTELETNHEKFWWLTGETPDTFNALHDRLQVQLSRPINGKNIRQMTINTKNRLLLALIWFRRYSVFPMLSFLFGISNTLAFEILHFTVPILHVHMVPRFIRWPNANEWQNQAGTYGHFPRVVGFLDGSAIRILKPAQRLQALFFRGDKRCHLINWILVTDTKGMIVFSRTGFPGRMHDSLCYRYVTLLI